MEALVIIKVISILNCNMSKLLLILNSWGTCIMVTESAIISSLLTYTINFPNACLLGKLWISIKLLMFFVFYFKGLLETLLNTRRLIALLSLAVPLRFLISGYCASQERMRSQTFVDVFILAILAPIPPYPCLNLHESLCPSAPWCFYFYFFPFFLFFPFFSLLLIQCSNQ